MGSAEKMCHMRVRVSEDTRMQLEYWSRKKSLSMTEFVHDAIDYYVGHLNHDYNLPDLEVQRNNQILDAITVLSSNIESLEQTTSSSLATLIGLTRGDNYLMDEDDGVI